MNYEQVPATEFAHSLRGMAVNLLCRDVGAMVTFLRDVLGMGVHRVSDDFAIATHDGTILQLHRDAAYGAHPVLGLVPEAGLRGGGVQFYLLNVDPDAAAARADPDSVIEAPRDKPHGLREATILSPEGYAFSPAVRA
jgi:catechol 2,3-dioxygenase-like lactoylglutathione lyase family enzyme